MVEGWWCERRRRHQGTGLFCALLDLSLVSTFSVEFDTHSLFFSSLCLKIPNHGGQLIIGQRPRQRHVSWITGARLIDYSSIPRITMSFIKWLRMARDNGSMVRHLRSACGSLTPICTSNMSPKFKVPVLASTQNLSPHTGKSGHFRQLMLPPTHLFSSCSPAKKK